ncbi:MAG TPA: hypothetical protein VIS06_13280 [Mycobacteriales bacterium]
MMRRVGLVAVVLGAMVLGVHGQVAAVEPLLGQGLGAVLAVTADLATLLALHEALSSRATSVRRWAWAVMLLAGGQSIGLNVWYAVDSGRLPWPVSVAIGAGPVVLAGLLSHLLALALGTEAEPTETGTASVSVRPEPVAVPDTMGTDPTGTSATGTRVPVRRVAVPQTITSVPARRTTAQRYPSGGGTGETAVPVELVSKARDVDARYRATHGKPAPARVLRTELRVRQDRALELRRALLTGDGMSGTAQTGTPTSPGGGTPTATGRQVLHLVPEAAGTDTPDPIGTAEEVTP